MLFPGVMLAAASAQPQCANSVPQGRRAPLLRRRIADASAAGVDFICSAAEFLSGSHRNMQRAGMRLQFVPAIWTAL